MNPGLVLVSELGDEHGDHVSNLLAQRGWEIHRVAYDMSDRARFTWQPGLPSTGFGNLDNRRWAGLWRRSGSQPTDEISDEFRSFVASEWKDAFEAALAVARIRWLSTISSIRRCELKMVQLARASELGLRHPRTVVTNDPLVAAEFARARSTIAKPVRYGLVSVDPPRIAWTRGVDVEDLRSIDGPPIILQERLRVQYHLRIVTIGEEAFASRLVTGDLDWRSNPENHDRFVKSDDHVDVRTAHEAVRMARSFGLGLSSQDWVISEDGTSYFLDLNPNGQWLFLDRPWKGAISEQLVRCLEMLVR